MNSSRLNAPLLKIDWLLLCGIAAIALLGLIILYSSKQDWILVQRQALRWALGAMLLLIVAHIPPFVYRFWAPILYWGTIVLLIAVLVVGTSAKGAQRWLNLGIIRFQPAEIMKLALPLYLASYFDYKILPPTFKDIFISLCIIALPSILVMLQPDLGTAILISACGGFILFFAGIPWRYLFGIVILGLFSLPLLFSRLHDYQRERILTLLYPERDPLGKGYHIIQSKIAIGSGGLQGKGWLASTQSNLDYLPERSTDFIFAVFSEEFGLLGIVLLFSLYLFIIFRGLNIGIQARGTFSRLLAGGLTMTFFVYVFVNIGMVCGLLPVVGIPLPLISYGGTSLLTLMIAFGLLMSIHGYRTLAIK